MHVKTSDGHTIEVSEKLRHASDFMKDAADDEELVVAHVTARQLELAQAFVDLITDEHPFPEIFKPFPLEKLHKIVGTVFADFVQQIDMNEVVPLVLAADFLGMSDLLELLCAHVAMTAYEGNLRLEV
jgi:hypothetical protein